MIRMNRLRWVLLVIAVAAGVAYVFGLSRESEKSLAMRAYLFAWLFGLGLSMGSLCLLLLHNLTGGPWGAAIRPVLRAAARTVPLLAVLFIPIALQLPALFPWARPDAVSDELWRHREPYLNVPFFLSRAVFYLAVWVVLALIVTRSRGLGRLMSALGLLIYLFTMTHAAFDWIMSRQVHFYSTTFGLIVTIGQTLSALALAILLLPLMPPALTDPPRPRALRIDLGNVLLTLVILWTYVSFMEFLVIWMGNSREDNAWFVQRGVGGGGGPALAWRAVAAALLLIHFFIPFFFLLFRSGKGNRAALRSIAALLLLAHIVEVFWLVAPADHRAPTFDPGWPDSAAILGMVALWGFVFLLILARQRPERNMDAVEGVLAHG